MVDSIRLANAIKASGLKKNFIYDRLGISRPTLNRKINGYSEFTLKEMQELSDMLRLSGREAREIFLSMNVNDTNN